MVIWVLYNSIELRGESVSLSRITPLSLLGLLFFCMATIRITCPTPGAVIRYTLDGSEPDENSSVYSSDLEVDTSTGSKTVKARGYKDGLLVSDTTSMFFEGTIPVPTLTLSRSGVVITGTIGNLDPSMTYYYKIGSAPTSSSDSSAVAISGTSFSLETADAVTIYVRGFNGSIMTEAVSDSVEEIVLPVAATPVISQSENNVSITCSSSGVTIHYTTNGSTPTENSTVYTGTFAISSSCTVKAIAVGSNYKDSAVASAYCTYTPPIIYPTNWTAISDMKFGTSPVASICYDNGRFVAVGGNNKGAYSTDGINWTGISFGGNGYIYSVCYGNGKFVAVGNSSFGAYSTDGITWTAISDMKISTAMSVCYSNGKFVAVGSNGKGVYSTDGINWTEISAMNMGTMTIQSVCYGNGRFVAVGNSGSVAAYSTDGITWTRVSNVGLSGYILSLCYGDGKFIAVTNGGRGAYSIDGAAWTTISDMKFGTTAINEICYGNGKFVAVGNSGKGAYSTDGINWTAISDVGFGTIAINSVCYGNDKFVAGGISNKGSYCIA